MRIAKCSVVMLVSLMLIAIGCGKKEKEVPSAAESMRKHKQLTIITDARNAPFEFGSGTGVQGFDVELGNEIAKTLGIEVKWVPVKPTDAARNPRVLPDYLFETLKKGDAEIILSAIAIDPKWENEFAFSKPYYETGDVIAHQRSVFDIKDLASLSGKQVGVGQGRPADAFMATQKVATNVSIKKYLTLDDALGALNRTEINAVVGDEIMLSYSSFNNFNSTTTLPDKVNKYQYAAVVRKSEPELLQKINETIDRLKSSGELQKYADNWIDDIVTKARGRGQEDIAVENKKKAPKTISVTITKVSGKWNMDRLDGFQLVLQGPAGRYQSTPILTEGNRGNCRFTTPVPPGDYSLNFSILGMTAKVPVPDAPKAALSMEISIGSTISISSK